MSERTDKPVIDWSLTTYEGARREQVRRWSQLSLTQVIEALEEMEQLAMQLGDRVPGASSPWTTSSGS